MLQFLIPESIPSLCIVLLKYTTYSEMLLFKVFCILDIIEHTYYATYVENFHLN